MKANGLKARITLIVFILRLLYLAIFWKIEILSIRLKIKGRSVES